MARMVGKRKRCHPREEDRKRANVEKTTVTPVKHPALGLYYRNILTLRDYLLSRLPSASKARRRKIASILPDTASFHHHDGEPSTMSQDGHSLSKLLNSTLVCTVNEQALRPEPSRIKDFEAFSQRTSPTAGSSTGGSTSSLSDLVDYAISLLFHKTHRRVHRPPHMLCHGFQRASNPRQANNDHCAVAGIPGIVSYYPNTNVQALKGSSWTEVLALLGQEGDRILLDLFLDCGIFVACDEGLDNYYQLSGNVYRGVRIFQVSSSSIATGTPLTELQSLSASNFDRKLIFSKSEHCNTSTSCHVPQSMPKSPTAITFVRNRMFYARAALNAKGRVTFGLRHIREFRRSAPLYRANVKQMS